MEGLLDLFDTALYGIVGNYGYASHVEFSKLARCNRSMLNLTPISLLFAITAWLMDGSPRSSEQSSQISQGNAKKLELRDRTYESQIKTVQLYPAFGARENEFLPAVTPLGQSNLVLEFDDIDQPVQRYYARIVHCNRDWTPSNLAALEYMTVYNEVPVTEYEFSIDTTVPYVHYRLNLPPVRLPGNYVVVVYREGDRDDIILSRRFMVFDNLVTIGRERGLIGPGRATGLNQQLHFKVSYRNVEIQNPMLDVSVTIRQNARWDNLAQDIKPAFVREDLRELEYRFFDPDQMFKGGNEFRFFDLRSINYPGRFVASVDKNSFPYRVYIQPDRSREHEAYSQYNDLNGQFAIENLDYRDPLAADYVEVIFTLQAEKVNGDVYVTGAFNYWNRDEYNRMEYDPATQSYQAAILLKQGWYDYQYVVESRDVSPLHFEGSHFETENLYEIFIYHRPFNINADLLIGYMSLYENPR
jgi:hypothetical protein